jgi:N6-L-threonylcarbamoyladenine synthase
LILSIESSCDDSSIAITDPKTKKLIFHKKISQDAEHSQYGGVVPELASRLHAKALPKILEETKPYFDELSAIAVTTKPGLSVTLQEGVMMAKALSLSLKLPLIGVNHLIGHIYSLFIEKESTFPMMVLLVSGGHTMLIEAKAFDEMNIVASTLDDSFGESFDKVAKMLGLGYPGGPVVERYAREGDREALDFPVPLLHSNRLAFSYSGLKNAVRLSIEEQKHSPQDICASFERTAVQHLLQKCKKVLKQSAIKDFAIVGGASQNLYLRGKFESLCQELGLRLHLAPLAFCADNAGMVGRVGVEMAQRGLFEELRSLEVVSKIKTL